MKTATLVLNILLLVGLIPSIFIAITSPMIFDAGESKRLWWTFGTAVALPILIVITQIFSWIAYSNQNFSFAFKISMIPVVNILLLFFFMLTMGATTPASKEKSKAADEQKKRILGYG